MIEIPREELIKVLDQYNATTAYIFGSQMDGISDSMSDIDIGVIFADKDILLDDALALQDDLQRLFVSIPVDLVFLEKASVMIAFKAISHGELIYTVNDEVRTDFEERVLRDYQDFAPFLNKFYHDVQEAIMGG